MHQASKAFERCWQAAGRHHEKMAQGLIDSSLREHVSLPWFEHLSFRLGNQLYFIRIEDADDVLEVPGSRAGLMSIASRCNGHYETANMKKTTSRSSASSSTSGRATVTTKNLSAC
jgi:hypothetical protein